jgi:acetyl esterase/lipase
MPPLPPPQPHPLRPAQRLALRGTRAAIAAMTPIQRVRGARARAGGARRARYGTRRAETLEVLEPAPGTPPRPAVVYVHGGGWIFGRKELYSADLAFLTARGHTVYNLDYPLAPEHPFPVALRSLGAALRWIAAESEDTRAEGVHLMGDSAGGNLVMMLALTRSDPDRFAELDLAPAGATLPPVRSVVSLYGVLDRSSWIEHGFPGARLMLHCYAGPAAFADEVGPELAVTPADVPVRRHPPCLLAIGTADPLAESSRIARARLRTGDVPVELIEYPAERHGFFNTPWRPASRKLRADVAGFLDRV